MNIGQQYSSSWNDDLIKKPDGKYKFGSMHLIVDHNKQMTIRQTYGLLDYIGDIGGLIDALYYLIIFILSPLWKFKFSSRLLTGLFRFKSDQKSTQTEMD